MINYIFYASVIQCWKNLQLGLDNKEMQHLNIMINSETHKLEYM